MHILVIVYEYPPVGGGGGQAAHDICQWLVSHGHQVHVLTAHMKGLSRQEELEGVSILRIPSGRRSAFRADLLAMAGYVLMGTLVGFRNIRRWQPDLIHVHFAVPSGPVAWLLSRCYHIPYVLTAHLGDVPMGVPEKTSRWFRWVYPFTPPIWRDAARVVAVSEFTRQLALRHYPVDIQVIPNGVDTARLKVDTISVQTPPQVVFAGRFVTQKNPIQLVRTLASLKHLPWRCVLLGDGPLRSRVEEEILAHEMEERFILTGWITPQEVIQWLYQSDILFMPSLSEGLPVIGVQALAMGLAIVASRVGGFIDLVDEGRNGYLIATDHAEEYAHALERLLSDTSRLQAFREASRQKAQKFDIHYVARAYESLFREVLGK